MHVVVAHLWRERAARVGCQFPPGVVGCEETLTNRKQSLQTPNLANMGCPPLTMPAEAMELGTTSALQTFDTVCSRFAVGSAVAKTDGSFARKISVTALDMDFPLRTCGDILGMGVVTAIGSIAASLFGVFQVTAINHKHLFAAVVHEDHLPIT